ncbi:hypothetical protein PY254_10435 [Rhodanobacter sp. AS-Z3]|jgi:hypothetical protein|uniref:hypothetical protein n=1 Tax=Rhodanobacter sp. AS-Z3 TaxID=3031330 RepID=UPI00247987EC|nr:hypothetical protein [Rhodanobacter sp. AS-Z3]WEN13663.1 hypothetical protein PY254_10435 [Rhodanobacter sp. AS-Z3]
MGFSLDLFFKDLMAVMDSDMKGAKKLRKLMTLIIEARAYAKTCGQLRDDA